MLINEVFFMNFKSLKYVSLLYKMELTGSTETITKPQYIHQRATWKIQTLQQENCYNSVMLLSPTA
jgi:hypothetical protein